MTEITCATTEIAFLGTSLFFTVFQTYSMAHLLQSVVNMHSSTNWEASRKHDHHSAPVCP